MNKDLVIFGAGELAEVAHFYFTKFSSYKVKAFCVDDGYINQSSLNGLPIISSSEIFQIYPPENTEMFIAIGYKKLNLYRKNKYTEYRNMGYRLASFLSEQATILNSVDDIGENCFILEDNTIQPFAKIGNNVTLWSGNHIGHHSTIGDHCFVTSHVVVSGGVSVGERCFIGVNSTIRDHVTIGDKCLLGAGTLLLENAGPDGVYVSKATERSRVPSSRIRNI